jgi:hypothetical protein
VKRVAVALVVFLGATGCAADLGLGSGAEATSGHWLAYGRAAGSTRIGSPLNESGFLVGTSLESRAEQDVGARFTTGLMAGYGAGPDAIGGKTLGLEAYGEFGTRIDDELFHHGDFFTGAAVAVPIRLLNAREITNLNDSTWLLLRRFEIVPLLRSRVDFDHPDGSSLIVHVEVEGGLSLRMRTFTDLF